LKLLPEEERHNLAGALQTLGTCFRELGEPEIALEYAFQAEALTPGLPRVVADKVKWLRANAWADLGKLSEAEELLRSVVRNLAEVHLGEMALATCDLMRVYLMDGRITEAFEAATALRALVEPLRDNKIASAAIAKLLRDGETGLTLALAEEVKTRIESELRHRPLWRCLWVVQDGH
jgi:tetratricopeptide (TPR) repeat protein